MGAGEAVAAATASEWRIVAGQELAATSERFRALLIGRAAQLAGRSFDAFDDMSAWLGGLGANKDAPARELRDWFKADPGVRAMLEDSPLAPLAREWLGGQAYLHPVVRLRTVMSGKDFTHSRPHQDAALWPEFGDHVNVWLPLVDITADLAPLCIVEGSGGRLRDHLRNEYDQMEVADAADLPPATPILLRVGEAVLFRPQIVHFSGRNLTDRIRWSLDCRFVKG